MIPIGILPHLITISEAGPMSGVWSMWVLLICNTSMVLLSIQLYIKMNVAAAKKVMFGSYFYLIIVLLSLYADKTRTNKMELLTIYKVEWKERR